MKLKYNDFLSMINNSGLPSLRLKPEFKNIARFFYVYGNQRDLISISEFYSYLQPSEKELYSAFGISFDSFVLTKSRYILFINPDEDYKEQISTQLDKLSPDSIFTDLVVLSNDDKKIEEVQNYFTESKSIDLNFCQIGSFNVDITLLKNQMMKKLCTDKIFDVFPYMKRISEATLYSVDSIAAFDSAVEEIAASCKGLIPVLLDDSQYTSIFLEVAVELYMRYGIVSYIPTKLHSDYVSKILFYLNSSESHLLSETLDYYAHLPSVMVDFNACCPIYYYLSKATIQVALKCVEYDKYDTGTWEGKVFDLNDIEINPLSNFFRLDTAGGCVEFKEFLGKVTKILNLDYLANFMRVLFFNYNHKVYVGYLIDANSIKCSVTAVYSCALGMSTRTLDLNALSKMMPLDCILGGPAKAKQFLNFLKKPYKKKYITPIKHYRKNSSFVSSHRFAISSPGWDGPYMDLMTFGLFSEYCQTVREGFKFTLSQHIGRNTYNESCDCFGGYLPVLVNNIYVK